MKGLPNPMGCRWCGIDQRPHARQWKLPVGWHKQPAQQQIKDRMRARRTARTL